MKRTQQGFIGIALGIGAIVVLVVGGGAYYVKKVNQKVPMANETTVMTNTGFQNTSMDTNVSADPKISTPIEARPVSSNVPVRMTLTDMLTINEGQSMQCSAVTTNNDATINTIVYINGKTVRGDSTIVHNGLPKKGGVIMKDGFMYAWTGTEGMKMKVSASFTLDTAMSISGSAMPSSYDCESWTVDSAKFALPAHIQFVDYGVMSLPNLE
jgi:hypothetical protein